MPVPVWLLEKVWWWLSDDVACGSASTVDRCTQQLTRGARPLFRKARPQSKPKVNYGGSHERCRRVVRGRAPSETRRQGCPNHHVLHPSDDLSQVRSVETFGIGSRSGWESPCARSVSLSSPFPRRSDALASFSVARGYHTTPPRERRGFFRRTVTPSKACSSSYMLVRVARERKSFVRPPESIETRFVTHNRKKKKFMLATRRTTVPPHTDTDVD